MEFKSMYKANPRFLKYELQLEKDVYQDGDVLNGNVAGFINSSNGREEIGNVQWKYMFLPTL